MARFSFGVPLITFAVSIVSIQNPLHSDPWKTKGKNLAQLRSLAGLLLLTTLVSLAGYAQNDPAAGVQMFSTNNFGVDLASSNINVNIPIRAKVGKLPFSYSLVLNSHAWLNIGVQWLVDGGLIGTPAGLLGTSVAALSQTGSDCVLHQIEYSNFGVRDSTGTWHPFPQFTQYACSTGSLGPFTTTDGSGYTLVIPNQRLNSTWILFDRQGNSKQIVFPGQTLDKPVQDPDGVTFSVSGYNPVTFTDTLGAAVLEQTIGSSGTSDTYTYPDSSQTYTVAYGTFNQLTNFQCPNKYEDSNNGVYFPISVTGSPSGETYTISYESTPNKSGYVTGRISKITFPTGGSVSYAYSGGNNNTGINCTSTVVPTLIVTVNDNNGNVGQWKYVNSNNSSSTGSYTVTQTDPAGNQTVYTFYGQYQTQELIYTGTATGTPSETVITCYNMNYSSQANCVTPTAAIGPAITQVDVYKSFSGSAFTLTETVRDTYGNTTSASSYDFGATFPPSGTPLSTIATTYNSGTTCGSLNQYIYDKPCSVTVNGPSGQVSQTNYTYNAEGHPTQAQKWVSSAANLNSYASYNSNGTVATSTDVNGTVTNISYNGTGGCNGLLPTSTVVNSLTTSLQWNCNGGVLTQISDDNANPTLYAFVYNDPLWRLTSVTDPVGVVTNTSYGLAPSTVEKIMNFNGSASTVDVLTVSDGLGRPYLTQRRQSPAAANYDTVRTFYDTDGRLNGVTVPFPCTRIGNCSSGVPTSAYQYDGVNRVTNYTSASGTSTAHTYTANTFYDDYVSLGPQVSGENKKRRQFEYDGGGNLKSVCEVASLPGSGTCNQSSPQTGFWTQYTHDAVGRLTNVLQNSQPGGSTQTRTFSYDGLNRLTSETNPETGNVSYTYDTDPTCGTFNGDLVKTVRAAVSTCSHYDALHRRTFISNANSNSCRFYSYDSNTGFGLTENNLRGRLSGAWVGNCTTGAVTSSKLGFNYSARGEALDTYQWSANSGGWYDVQATYWANGALNTIDYDKPSGADILIPTITYGVDGEGRISTVSGSSLQNPVTSTTYNTANQVTGVTFGSGDSDSYQFIAPSLQMKQYNYNVGSSTVTGTLTWNANGSLGTLAITDPLNSKDAQTCNYAYDDLARLASANCGTTWSQTFSYDPFGNITKSGSISWQPGYDATSNHYTLAGTSYDANGNLTADTFHTYSWDGNFGNPLSIDTTNLTYDPLGRLAETANGTTYTQFVYGPTGKLAQMNGQTVVKVFIALPAGDQAVYTGANSLQGYRHGDWLGSSRIKSSTTQTKQFDGAYAPFGESYADSGSYDHFFTGQIPGVVSDTYDFLYRQYNPKQGRWLSPDPAGAGAAQPTNPQTWNRYGYVTNNPLAMSDPSGLNPLDVFYREYQPCGGLTWDPTCGYFGAFMSDLGWTAFIETLASQSVEVPTGQWYVIGADGGTLVVGGCDGCVNQELPVMQTIYPYAGLVALLGPVQTPPPQGPQGPKTPQTQTPDQIKQQKCAAAKANLAAIGSQGNAMAKTMLKEMGAGAGIGCVVGFVGTEELFPVVGTPLAIGDCAVGAIGGALTAVGVFAITNAGDIVSGNISEAKAVAQVVQNCS